MLRIEAFGFGLAQALDLDGGNGQAGLLETGNDLPDDAALDSVGFDDDESGFHDGRFPFLWFGTKLITPLEFGNFGLPIASNRALPGHAESAQDVSKSILAVYIIPTAGEWAVKRI
jgi:hypothetical protein